MPDRMEIHVPPRFEPGVCRNSIVTVYALSLLSRDIVRTRADVHIFAGAGWFTTDGLRAGALLAGSARAGAAAEGFAAVSVEDQDGGVAAEVASPAASGPAGQRSPVRVCRTPALSGPVGATAGGWTAARLSSPHRMRISLRGRQRPWQTPRSSTSTALS